MRPDDTAPEGAVCIPLRARDGSVRAYALVDAADAEFVNQWRWSLTDNGYVKRGTMRAGGVKLQFYLHRELMGLVAGSGSEIDHINRDKLDNRRSNLRVVNRSANMQNSPGRSKTSRFRGVSWVSSRRRWAVFVKVDGKSRRIGDFASEAEAAEAARHARKEFYPFSTD